jgi:hypothetical protein
MPKVLVEGPAEVAPFLAKSLVFFGDLCFVCQLRSKR